jgi:hypothetical protein
MKKTSILFVFAYITLSSFRNDFCDVKNNPSPTLSTLSFNEFRVHRNGQDKVACVWAFNNETGITRYEVLKTYNDLTDPYAIWEVVATVTPNATRTYKIIDSPVYPGYINYKLKAYYSNGSFVESTTITVRINARN